MRFSVSLPRPNNRPSTHTHPPKTAPLPSVPDDVPARVWRVPRGPHRERHTLRSGSETVVSARGAGEEAVTNPKQLQSATQTKGVRQQALTDTLAVAYETYGPSDGPPVVLLHGFPYSARAYDEVAPGLAAAGARVVVPDLRGYGSTRFRNPDTPRSGEQAALGQDLMDLVGALGLERPVVAGYDWGGRAACVAAAVRPDLVGGLVTVTGYNVFGPPMDRPLSPAVEHTLWYQYYLHLERGRAMLEENRRGFCRYLWRLWSPTWEFSDATFAESAVAFDNPDFVDVVLHSYRHRCGLAPGDPALAALAARLTTRPTINVPTVVLHGDQDPAPLASSEQRGRFTGPWRRRVVPGAGHNLPQETPGPVIDAVFDLLDERS